MKMETTYIVRQLSYLCTRNTGSNLWDVVNSFKSDLVCLCSALPARLVNSRSVVLVALHGGIRTVLSLVQREGTDKATYSVPSVAIE